MIKRLPDETKPADPKGSSLDSGEKLDSNVKLQDNRKTGMCTQKVENRKIKETRAKSPRKNKPIDVIESQEHIFTMKSRCKLQR